MRCLVRNKRKFYYATYTGKTPVVDSNGFETGEYSLGYSAPVKAYANISQSTGRANTEQFGIDLSYDKVLVTDKMTLPITEESIIWIDKEPNVVNGVVTNPHDYIVKKIAKSLNSISIALSRVDVK